MKRRVASLHARDRGADERDGREQEQGRDCHEETPRGPEWKRLAVFEEFTEKNGGDEKQRW